jgi:hypothetical protein
MNLRHGFVCLLLVAFVGCSGHPKTMPTVAIKGTVTYQGKPLGTGRIIFYHPSGQAVATDLAADGSFSLNAFQGKNQVEVKCFGPDYPNPNPRGRPRMLPGKSLIPSRYAEAATSGLTCEVKASTTTKVEIALTD